MLDYINTLYSWKAWLLGGSTLTLMLLALVVWKGGDTAMKIVQTFVDAIVPPLSQFVVWAIKSLGDSIRFCLTNSLTYGTILAALLLGGYFLTDINPKTVAAKAQVVVLKKENAELKKKTVKPLPKKAPASTDPWSGWTL